MALLAAIAFTILAAVGIANGRGTTVVVCLPNAVLSFAASFLATIWAAISETEP